MIFFKVSQNINIKIADNSLVVLTKAPRRDNIEDFIYVTTYSDYEAVKKIFTKVGTNYKALVVDEKKIISTKGFPQELGVSNFGEFSQQKRKQKEIGFLDLIDRFNKETFFKNEQFKDILSIVQSPKKEISIAIIGGVGRDIGEILCGLSAVRIMYKILKARYKDIKIDLLLESAENPYYKRDKEIIENEAYINKVAPLCQSVKKMQEYDYFIDNSNLKGNIFFNELGFIDGYLYKFGINPNKIPPHLKHNQLNLSNYKPNDELKNELDKLSIKSNLTLFHPYTPDANRSLPKDIALSMLKELNILSDDIVISALKIEKYENDKFVDLSKYSKNALDFIYIISRCNKILTVDTSTYHISDMFLIPTVVIFDNEEIAKKRIKYYHSIKTYILKEKKKDLSLLRFDNDTLVISKYAKYKNIKIKKILQLLDN